MAPAIAELSVLNNTDANPVADRDKYHNHIIMLDEPRQPLKAAFFMSSRVPSETEDFRQIPGAPGQFR
jgi:hypothetical protein